MDFDKRLEQAIARGAQSRTAQDRQQAAAALTEEEYKRLYTRYRLELSEHIEQCLRKMADLMPGFALENVVGDRGWGAAIRRDDLTVDSNRARNNLFSRLEMVVRPANSFHVLDIAAKGTIRNKENFQRDQYAKLDVVNSEVFRQVIQQWAIEYAELYTAQA